MIFLFLFMNRDYSYLKVLYKVRRFQLSISNTLSNICHLTKIIIIGNTVMKWMKLYRIRDTIEYLEPETT